MCCPGKGASFSLRNSSKLIRGVIPKLVRQRNSPKRKGGDEKITGRRARGLQMEETGCKHQTFFTSLLSGRRKQTTSVRFLASLIAQLVKNTLAMQEILVRFLGQEDLLEKG